MAKDWWDKAEISAKILIPIVIIVCSYFINSSIHNREIQQKERELRQQNNQKELEQSQKYIEIAVNILNSDPSKEKKEEPLREWAIDIFKKYSPIELSPAAIKALKNQPLSTNATLKPAGMSVQSQLGQPKIHGGQNDTVSVSRNQTKTVFGGKLSISVQNIKAWVCGI